MARQTDQPTNSLVTQVQALALPHPLSSAPRGGAFFTPRGLVVAGGETSGAICRRLELGAFRVGKNIDPGVPLCYSLGKFKLPVALKSGNFGAPDFYLKAVNAINSRKEYLL